MDYKEKYEQALKRAQKELQTCGSTDCDAAKQIFRLFPELKEDEDELEWLKQFIQEEAYILSMDIRDDEDSFRLKNLQRSLEWLEKQGKQKVSYTTIVETGNGGINTLVTGELPIDGEQKPIEFKWSADDKNKLLIIEQILDCANLLISSQELTEIKNWLKSLKQRVGG